MSIQEFLRQRLAEDEASARAALDLKGSGTQWPLGHPLDPARVLAEVAAKRQILDMDPPNGGTFDDDAEDGIRYDPWPPLVHLARVYKGHSDFDERWR